MPYSWPMRFLVLGLVLLVGCTSPEQSLAEPARPITPPAKAERYETLDDLLVGLDMGNEVASSGVGNNEGSLKDFVEIYVGGGVVDIYLFENRKQRDAWMLQMVGVVELVYGPNWIVTPFSNTSDVLGAMGGTFVPLDTNP